jgi:hypothetical protein
MNAKLDALGLVLDSDPRRVTKTGVLQSETAAGDSAGDGADDAIRRAALRLVENE